MAAEQLIGIGIIVIVIGFILIITGSLLAASKGKSRSNFAIVGFLGPLPFGAASDRNLLYLAIAITVVLFVLFLLLGRKLFI